MTRVLGSIVILLLIVAVIGYLRGWISFESSSTPNQSNINVTVDKDAVRQDEAKFHNDVDSTTQKLTQTNP